jgi:hypothetical protein
LNATGEEAMMPFGGEVLVRPVGVTMLDRDTLITAIDAVFWEHDA